LLLCCGIASAQQNVAPNNPSTENSQTTEARLREKAFDLLESLADQIGTLQSPENRARLASNLAASLWTHDQKRARTLLLAVENEIRTELQSLEDNDPADDETRLALLQLRGDTVERIARYDPEPALAFLKATEMSSDQQRKFGLAEAEQALELRLAKQMAAENPDMALRLGRHTLERGFSYDLIGLLVQLSTKHSETAVILYKDIVARLRATSLVSDQDASYFALSLVRSFRPPQADEQTFRDLIGLFITAALENGCGKKMAEDDSRAGFCGEIMWLWPLMEKADPLRAGPLKQWASGSQSTEWQQDRVENLNEGVLEAPAAATVDDILALESKYPQLKDQIQWQALKKAEAVGDTERARKIAADFDGDPELKQRMREEIERDQAWASLNEKKLDELQKELNALPGTPEKVGLLFSVAGRIGTRDRKTFLKLLEQAGTLIDSIKPGGLQTALQIGLATMYCSAGNERGFAIMGSLLPRLNELVAAAVKLEGYDTHNVRDGEWNMTGAGMVGSLLTVLSQNAGYFAWADFDRAVNMAAQFERPELRLMAQLKLAQSILAGRPQPPSMMSPQVIIQK